MTSIKATQARSKLYSLIEEANASHHPIQIIGKSGNAALISEEDWRAIFETLQLGSIPGMVDSIKKGMKDKIEKLYQGTGRVGGRVVFTKLRRPHSSGCVLATAGRAWRYRRGPLNLMHDLQNSPSAGAVSPALNRLGRIANSSVLRKRFPSFWIFGTFRPLSREGGAHLIQQLLGRFPKRAQAIFGEDERFE